MMSRLDPVTQSFEPTADSTMAAEYQHEQSPRPDTQPSFASEKTSEKPSEKPSLSSLASNNQQDAIPSDTNPADVEAAREDEPDPTKAPQGIAFWLVFFPLCLAVFMATIESTIISSALPYITRQLNSGNNYVWFVNAYLLCKCAFLPLWGQISSVLGRRWPQMAAIAFFILGSGLAGGATSTAMMICGRAIQGIGGGGITILGQLILNDLVSPRAIPKYTGYLIAAGSLGTAIGPFIGGAIVENISWRWVFYINLPIGAVLLVLAFLFVRMKYTAQQTMAEKVKRIDFLGNALIIAATTAILIALSWGGARYPWQSANVLAPLIIGVFGLVGAFLYEAYAPWVVEPTVHTVIFRNYSTDINIFSALLQMTFAVWTTYFLPVYFQAVLLENTEISGVMLLPTVFLPLPLAMLVGRLITKLGRYKLFHMAGFALFMVGFGLFTIFGVNTSLAVVIISMCVWSLGSGALTTSTLPGVQASVPEELRSSATSTWSFFREFGGVWGISVPSAIFNSQFANLAAQRIADVSVRNEFVEGTGYSHASASSIAPLTGATRQQVLSVYVDSLKLVFQIALGLAGLCFLLVCVQKEYKLRTAIKTQHVLESRKKKNRDVEQQ